MAELIPILMPDGEVEFLAPTELLWMREALVHENAKVMIRTGTKRLYSSELVADIRQKFEEQQIKFAVFTPPEGSIDMVVSALTVREVDEPLKDVFHEQARAVLKFGGMFLAVREDVAEAENKLEEAGWEKPRQRTSRRARSTAEKKSKSKTRSRKPRGRQASRPRER